MEYITNIEDKIKQNDDNTIDIKYTEYNKDNDNIDINNEQKLIETIASLYCDFIYINKENNQNKDTILGKTIQTIFENIKTNLLKILSLEEKIDEIFKKHVDNIFKKINNFKDDIFRKEGPKDKILFLFFMKKIDFFLEKQKNNIYKNGNMNSSHKISSTEITSCLDICKIIKDYENRNYKIKISDNKIYNFNPSFTDQTLIYGLSNIIAYIKACFIIYSIHICSAIYNAFPMLFKSLMKINKLKKTLFDNKNSNKNTTDLLKELEINDGNSNITYLYRQILNSPICINNKLYNSITVKKRYKILSNGEETDETERKDDIFTKTAEFKGSFTYDINLENSNANDVYKKIHKNIQEIKNNTIAKLINGVYNKEITKIKKKKETLIDLLKNINQKDKKIFYNIFFKENNTKYIADKSIIYFYKTSNDKDLEDVKYDELYK